jgi:acyl-coenzyme A thioesterase PaaI-like protein
MSIKEPVTNRLDVARVEALIDARFPQIHAGGRTLVVEEVGPGTARVRFKSRDHHVRPGGTISGVAMFTLADFSVYAAIIATLGEAGIEAVTTNLNINFPIAPHTFQSQAISVH